MALRPPGNPQLLLHRALSAIKTLCHPGRDNLLTVPPSLVQQSNSVSISPNFSVTGSPVLQTSDHGGDRRGVSSSGACIKATLFPGDGIGPEIADSVKKNLANPAAILVMLLQHLKMTEPAGMIHKSILQTIAEGKYRTGDLGGSATCTAQGTYRRPWEIVDTCTQ